MHGGQGSDADTAQCQPGSASGKVTAPCMGAISHIRQSPNFNLLLNGARARVLKPDWLLLMQYGGSLNLIGWITI